MTKTRDQLFERLSSLGISTSTKEHSVVFTVSEAKALRGDFPGAHSKNLFLKDKKGKLWMIVCEEDRSIDMKQLRHTIGSGHLSFGAPDLLIQVLGVQPGSVSPFALINDVDCRVNVVLDAEMMNTSRLNFHPLENSATTSITPNDLILFIKSCGHLPVILNL